MNNEQHLYEKLIDYSAGDAYPYHMPGHKRRMYGELAEPLFKMDITEIDGFDDLHHSEEILLELQKRTAGIYGAEESFWMVNGSSGGVLTAISAALPPGGHLLMARNCHRSAYHGAYLRQLKVSYLEPGTVEGFSICEAIEPGQVEEALRQMPDVGAVLIVSPTYEGRIANVREIADVVHARGIPLIVDEAHGSHLGLHDCMPPGSVSQGADLVIQSVHKTLPAMTQTALLHANYHAGGGMDRERVMRFLRIYQTSSPSYVLMASIDNALTLAAGEGERLFPRFYQLFQSMLAELSACKYLRFLPLEDKRQDVGKLVISTAGTSLTGKELYDRLREQYHLQLELAAGDYCLAMFTLADQEEGYRRMRDALLEIDADLQPEDEPRSSRLQDPEETYGGVNDPEKVLPLHVAWDAPATWVELEKALGRYAGEFVQVYPPGVPILVPGEVVDQPRIDRIITAIQKNLNLQGLEIRQEGPYLRVLTEPEL